MMSIVIVFSRRETALGIRRILAQSGYHVQTVCATGGQALAAIGDLESGIVVCGARFVDMMYTELYDYLPEGFQMLLIASADYIIDRQVENLVCLSMPMKVHELLQTVEMMESAINRRKKRMRALPAKRTVEERAVIERAKSVLMERNSFTEEEAHRYIQKRSMENGTGLVEVAQMILSLMGEG